MGSPFELIGKLTIGKESEKFKPYEEITYDSGWQKRVLKFNAVCGDNRHMMTIGNSSGGCWKDGHGDTHLFSKGSVDGNGKKNKGSSFAIPFKDRLTSPKLAEVAEFKKLIIDLEKPNRRYLLQQAFDKIHEGKEITNEELKAIEVETENEVAEALEKSKKKRHEFVTEWDFAEFMKKVLELDKYKNKKFKITGNIEDTYSDKSKKFYSNFTPSRIYLANDEDTEMSTATITLFYNKDSLDSGNIEIDKKYYINGYVFNYDSSRKCQIPCPKTIVLSLPSDDADEKVKKSANIYVKQFTVDDDSWKQLGVVVNLIDGAQKIEIDESMLTEFQQEMILLGEITLDDIRKELGRSVYGEKVQENLFVKLARGCSKGREDTVFQDENFEIKPIDDDNSSELIEEVSNELFDEDEDI